MSDGSSTKGLRDRLTSGTEDRLGKALADLFDNPLVGGALGRAADAREKATQAQEVAMGALNLPSAADIERLTRRLRSVSQRLEGIEDGVHRLGRVLPAQALDARLGAIEQQLKTLAKTLGEIRGGSVPLAAPEAAAKGKPATKPRASAKPRAATNAKALAKAKAAARARPAAKPKPAASRQPAASRKPAASSKPAASRATGGR
jgi:hypothetical protein